MALGVYFTPNSFTAEEYDEVTKRLEAVGRAAELGGRVVEKSARRG